MRTILIATTAALFLCGCSSYDEGYAKGQSDSIKELYWAQVELQKQKDTPADSDNIQYYTYDGQTQSPDGTRYGEHAIRVPVIK